MGRARRGRGSWTREETDIDDIEGNLGFPIRKWIKGRVGAEDKVLVVDWGCGKGTALRQVVCSEGLEEVRAPGYCMEQYDEFEDKHERIKFVHSIGFKRLPGLLKDKSVDLIYGYFSLFHLGEHNVKDEGKYLKRGRKEIKKSFHNINRVVNGLIPKLKEGGVLIFFLDSEDYGNFLESLEGMRKWKVYELVRHENKDISVGGGIVVKSNIYWAVFKVKIGKEKTIMVRVCRLKPLKNFRYNSVMVQRLGSEYNHEAE